MSVIVAFLPAILGGILLAHLLWPDRSLGAVAFKVFLGSGLGMGVRSILYFLYLLVLPGRHMYLYLELSLVAVLIGLTVLAERRAGAVSWSGRALPRLSSVQSIALVVASVVVLTSLLASANYLLRRRQGDWDAWMMYNRAARFLYKDQLHWLASFSPRMDPIFHNDYPLLLAGDIVAGWEILGRETSAVPMLQSALFSVAAVGLIAAALALVKSVGQAMLGITLLWGLPVFVNEGARQMADVPLAFFILAAVVLLTLSTLKPRPGLLALAGLAAGLGAWTKNEGSLLVLGTGLAILFLILRQRDWRALIPFAAGIALPLATVISFRLFIAPSGDMLAAAAGGTLAQILDLSRHAMILQHIWGEIIGFGAWGIPGFGVGILPILMIYWILFGRRRSSGGAGALRLGFIILTVQLLGYYAAYLVSPYELSWHLNYSSSRIIVQIMPLLVFLLLSAAVDLESVFAAQPRRSSE